ncbi:MAG: hypothetical protein ACD_10C00567G0002 [uncultured bacterium]|nr:MAG: hypothetical protein ACD_10C00567G0002 [uncultured bacterium]
MLVFFCSFFKPERYSGAFMQRSARFHYQAKLPGKIILFDPGRSFP